MDYNWYLFFSQIFAQGSTFTTDQNILAISEFMAPSSGGGSGSGSSTPTDFSDANNILANQEFGG
jgi:hypothetical protein